jgi:hypothetical protein
MNKLKCPKCKTEWFADTEQGACLILFGECLCCRRFDVIEEEIRQINEYVYGKEPLMPTKTE